VPDAIDWSAPWLAPYRSAGERVQRHLTDGARVAQALNLESSGDTPRFVAQDELPAGEGYEAFVRRTRSVPTRDNLHDLLNGLVWLHDAPLKWRLNELHAAALPRTDGRRGPLRDALTLFDENGGWMEGPDEVLQALREGAWQRLFVALRPCWREVRITLIGHGLLEKLLQPRKPITAHLLAARTALDEATLASKPFLPLPVLGVPGWWAANEDASFYDDASVFRAPRPAGSLRSTGSARPCRS
jgi:hypothetical protein